MSYPVHESYASIQNVLLIDESVTQAQVLYDNVSSNTLPILYNSNTSADEINTILSGHFTTLQRIAFVFDGPPNDSGFYPKSFLDSKPFFLVDPSGSLIPSNNIDWITHLIRQFSISRVDFLGCNLLQLEEWKTYFNVLTSDTCIVGASINETGNLKYGGDWVLENTHEDIKNVYFSTVIDSYSGVLVTTAITTNKTLTQSGSELTDGTTTYSWSGGPVPIQANVTVTFGGNLTITNTNQYFSITTSNVTIDGGNNIINISSGTNYAGLFNFSSGLSNITLKNINIVVNRPATLAGGAFSGYNITYPNGLNVINCSVSGNTILPIMAATFFGQANGGSGCSLSNTTMTNCFNSITLKDHNGFFSKQAVINSNCVLTLRNCYNTGNVLANSGVFLNSYTTLNANSTVNLINCFNIANIEQNYSGGFIGCNIGGGTGSAINLTNCYHIGNLSVAGTSAFFSQGMFYQGTGCIVNFTNCYCIGNFILSGDNGVFLAQSGGNGTVNLNNCYMFNTNASGINTYYNTGTTVNLTATNCYKAMGSWSDAAASATGFLINTPSSTLSPGSVWASVASNTPYLLSNIVSAYIPNSITQTGVSAYTVPITPNVFSGTTFAVTVNGNVSSYATMSSSGNILFQNLPSSVAASYTAQVLSYTLVNGQYAAYAFSSFTLTNKAIPALQSIDLSSNTYTLSLTTPGVAITTKEELSTTVKAFLTSNASSLASSNLVITGSTLPGFSNFTIKNTSNKITVLNSSSTCGTNYKSVFSSSDLIGKVFYILQDSSGDITTLNTFAGTPVTVTNIGNGFTISSGIGGTPVPYAVGSTFSLEGLRFCLGSIFGESTNIVCFKEGTKILSLKNGSEIYVPIEQLKKGDLIKTANLARPYVAVHQIGSRELDNPTGLERTKDRLYSCFPSDYPSLEEELVLTGCHSILVDQLSSSEKEKTLEALGDIYTTDGKYRLMTYLDQKAEPYDEEGTFTIWHVALEHEDDYMNYGIYANGLLVESCSKRMMKEYSGFN